MRAIVSNYVHLREAQGREPDSELLAAIEIELGKLEELRAELSGQRLND